MVARVDRALKDDLGIADGLAAENVYVLDPCCGTGAYLAEVLRRIATKPGRAKRTGRPHRRAGEAGGHRARVRLRDHARAVRRRPPPGRPNHAVARRPAGGRRIRSGPASSSPTPSPAGTPDGATSRSHSRSSKRSATAQAKVKQETPILVILGNPPYNGYAGMAVDEERELVDTPTALPRRCGDRRDMDSTTFTSGSSVWPNCRIAEKTGRGVVCFISNYSWLDGLSFTGMRERYLEDVRRDSGRLPKRRQVSRLARQPPDGKPDPSETVSTRFEAVPVGIQVGTAITLLPSFDKCRFIVRAKCSQYRDFHQALGRRPNVEAVDWRAGEAAEFDSGLYKKVEP